MALEAIYGHDLAVFGNIGGLRYFQVSSVATIFFSFVLVSWHFGFDGFSLYFRFAYVMMWLMASKCVQSFHQLMCVPKMKGALMVQGKVMDQQVQLRVPTSSDIDMLTYTLIS
jgi:hypothetical protein